MSDIERERELQATIERHDQFIAGLMEAIEAVEKGCPMCTAEGWSRKARDLVYQLIEHRTVYWQHSSMEIGQ